MAPKFLYLAWMEQVWRDYLQAATPPILKGRAIGLTPRQYGAALLMSKLGEIYLGRLASEAGVDLDT